MRWALEPVSGPDLEVVTLARMKRELDEFSDITERDDDITAKIVAAREWAEDYTGRVLVDQTWRLSVTTSGRVRDELSVYLPQRTNLYGDTEWRKVGELFLRRTPVLAITSFVSVDEDGVETAVDAATYQLRDADSKWPRLLAIGSATWQNETHLKVTFRAGYADRTGSPIQDASVVPDRFKEAIILYVKFLYDGDMESKTAAEKILRRLSTYHGIA